MRLSRREMLKLGVLGSAALALPLQRVSSAVTPPRLPAANLPRPFTRPFVVPPTARPSRQDPETGTDVYAMEMVQVPQEIIPGFLTNLWMYRDGFGNLGPTVEAVQGRPVRMRMANVLPTHPQLGYTPATSVHLHGSASLPQFDGYASDVTWPGWYKDYEFPNLQNARTLWYHDHGVHRTASNAYMGLAGMYRITDDHERSLPIPKGRYDVPLLVRDAAFDVNGQLLYDDDGQSGVYGDVILVNNVPWPLMKVERRKYRFRVLNCSVSRSFRWRLSTGDPFTVIATDAGLMPRPVEVDEMRHGVAERYEIVIDFSRYPIGKRVVLQNRSNRNNVDFRNTNKVMAFKVVAEASSTDDDEIPAELDPDNPVMALTADQAVAARTLDLKRKNGLWTVNGRTWDDVVRSGFTAVEANPELGDIDIWNVSNDRGGWNHPLHIHLVDFKILDRNGLPPEPYEVGPKDVVYAGEYEQIRVIAQYHREGKYMIHCHNLVHEDHDMMVQYEVGRGGPDPLSAPARPLPAPPL